MLTLTANRGFGRYGGFGDGFGLTAALSSAKAVYRARYGVALPRRAEAQLRARWDEVSPLGWDMATAFSAQYMDDLADQFPPTPQELGAVAGAGNGASTGGGALAAAGKLPSWLLPVGIGVGALVLGGVVLFVLKRKKG